MAMDEVGEGGIWKEIWETITKRKLRRIRNENRKRNKDEDR